VADAISSIGAAHRSDGIITNVSAGIGVFEKEGYAERARLFEQSEDRQKCTINLVTTLLGAHPYLKLKACISHNIWYSVFANAGMAPGHLI
jgi:hypothetical protein